MINTVLGKLYYYVVRVAIKLRLFVFDYSFEPVFGGEDDGAMSLVISGRWRWQKKDV